VFPGSVMFGAPRVGPGSQRDHRDDAGSKKRVDHGRWSQQPSMQWSLRPVTEDKASIRFLRSHVVSCSVRIPFLLPYNEADLSGEIDLAQHPFSTSSILVGCLGPSFAAWQFVSSVPCSTDQDTHGALLNSPTIPHDRVEGTLNPSFSHSHPHINPCHPNHIK
jgi:hypothetical protein